MMFTTYRCITPNHDVARGAPDDTEEGLSPLLTIPLEILQHIAYFTSKRYDYQRRANVEAIGKTSCKPAFVLANSDLTALASTCRAVRDALFPLLFEDITIGCSSR